MTKEEISQIYDQLTELEIQLIQTPELGTEYLRDKLLECRQKQNTVTELIVRVNRAYSAARQAVRAQETACRVAGVSQRGVELRDELATMLDERDALKYLIEALNVRRANLGRTSSDIRLMNGIIETELNNANAGQQRKNKPAPPPPPEPTPAAEKRLGPQEPPTVADFEAGMAEIAAKVKAQEIVVPPATNPAPEIITDASELLADTPAPPPTAKVEPEAKTKKEPAKPTMAGDDEIDMDAFLES